MTLLSDILADADDIGALLQLIVLAAVVIIAGAAKWLGRKLEQKQAEQQVAEQARRQQEAQEEARSHPPRRQTTQTHQARREKMRPQALPPTVLEPIEPHGVVETEAGLASDSKDRTYDWTSHRAMPSAALPASASKVDLSGPDALRRAFIYHELLSAPKALRRDPEQWDI